MNIKPKIFKLKFKNLSTKCSKHEEEFNGQCSLNKILYIEVVAKYLIRKTVETQKTFELKMIKCFGVFYILSIIILRIYGFSQSQYDFDPADIVYTVFSCYKAFVASTQFVSFIAAGLYDFKRKKVLMTQCSGLISKKIDTKYTLFDKDDKPELDLKAPDSIIG